MSLQDEVQAQRAQTARSDGLLYTRQPFALISRVVRSALCPEFRLRDSSSVAPSSRQRSPWSSYRSRGSPGGLPGPVRHRRFRPHA